MKINVNKITKMITVVLIAMMVIATITPVFAATDPSKYTGAGSGASTEKIDSLGQDIVKIVSTIGSVISVIVLIVLGIKYMMGSAEEKADYKKSLIPYVVGAALVFTASVFAQSIYEFFNGWTTA